MNLFSFLCDMQDYKHRGVTNNFLMQTRDELFLLSKDMHVLQQNSCAQAFTLLRDDSTNILSSSIPQNMNRRLRELMITLVLATDHESAEEHATFIQQVKQIITPSSVSVSSSSSSSKSLSGCFEFDLSSDVHRELAMRFVLRLADCSNALKPHALYTRWTERLFKEVGDAVKREFMEFVFLFCVFFL